MTYLVERLAQLRTHLDHLAQLESRVDGADDLQRDLSLHNDVLFSLLMVCQLVIDIAGELAARRGAKFEDYAGAVRGLAAYDEMPDELIGDLSMLPGFRNVLIHEYVELDLNRAVDALRGLASVRRFAEIVRQMELSR
ncbi:MAG: HepT-like ribonuclease domain-containing protein [Planctomycetota bacterium]|jgi:uncharacterized protein YutE (UPF0331/DUF86 family)